MIDIETEVFSIVSAEVRKKMLIDLELEDLITE